MSFLFYSIAAWGQDFMLAPFDVNFEKADGAFGAVAPAGLGQRQGVGVLLGHRIALGPVRCGDGGVEGGARAPCDIDIIENEGSSLSADAEGEVDVVWAGSAESREGGWVWLQIEPGPPVFVENPGDGKLHRVCCAVVNVEAVFDVI